MEADRCASVCGMATGVIVWTLQSRLRSVSPWAEKGGVGLWRIVRPLVVAPWAYVWSTGLGE